MEEIKANKPVEILIVEDSLTQAEKLRFILEKNNFSVSHAVNGRKAVEMLSGSTPDVVITDVLMPEMDGYELCGWIRSNERLKKIPVILVTSLSDPTDVIKGLEVGANNFITKPYDDSYLLSRLQYLFANSALRKHHKAEMGINVYFSGQNYFITAERLQILDLLLSTYENAYRQNLDLLNAQKELRELNERLEEIVQERTAELSRTNSLLSLELAENKRVEAEKDKLQDQLYQAQKMESVGQLAGGVAHDFNNMLSVIIGFTQLCMDKIDPSQPMHGDLREILNAANRSVNITRQLLAFARKQTICPKVIDLNGAIDGTLKMLRRLIGEDIELKWCPQTDIQPVNMDPSQLDQVLANLCINGRDAIRGSGEIRIETGMAHFEAEECVPQSGMLPGDYVLISVSDSGCGMSREILAKIFDPFFTTKHPGSGTGLGLSTVYGIVSQNNGFIRVYSEVGKGTTFRVYLPRHEGTPEKISEQNGTPPVCGNGEKVLVVEDEEAILRLAQSLLVGLGYDVITADKPSEAIRQARAHDIVDLLLTDVIMPEMDGLALSKQLQEIHPNLKCLFMSGYTATVIATKGVLDEGVHLVEKPFTRKALAVKVREALSDG